MQLTGSDPAEQKPQEPVLEDMDKDKDKAESKDKDEEQEVLRGSQQAEGLVGLEKDVMSILNLTRDKEKLKKFFEFLENVTSQTEFQQ